MGEIFLNDILQAALFSDLSLVCRGVCGMRLVWQWTQEKVQIVLRHILWESFLHCWIVSWIAFSDRFENEIRAQQPQEAHNYFISRNSRESRNQKKIVQFNQPNLLPPQNLFMFKPHQPYLSPSTSNSSHQISNSQEQSKYLYISFIFHRKSVS
jgi:arginine exporter protein ArgO